MSELSDDFTRMTRRSMTCEIHILINSRNLMLTVEEGGYCGNRAAWWYQGVYALCPGHAAAVMEVARESA